MTEQKDGIVKVVFDVSIPTEAFTLELMKDELVDAGLTIRRTFQNDTLGDIPAKCSISAEGSADAVKKAGYLKFVKSVRPLGTAIATKPE